MHNNSTQQAFVYQSILHIDDDPISHLITCALLQQMQVAKNIEKVYNGREALDFLYNIGQESINDEHHFFPALILLDISMPVMDGFEFLESFTSTEFFLAHDITIAILTSSTHGLDYQRAKAYPLAAILEKPISLKKIQQVIDFKKK